MTDKKPRYFKKETLAHNVLQGCRTPFDLQYLDKNIAASYDANKEMVEKHKDRMKKFEALYTEFYNDKKKFVIKYAKDNTRVMRILNENPNLFDDL